ncbi:MAG: hypothetical protein WBC22_17930 [Sedimentisphaerales bacterium]
MFWKRPHIKRNDKPEAVVKKWLVAVGKSYVVIFVTCFGAFAGSYFVFWAKIMLRMSKIPLSVVDGFVRTMGLMAVHCTVGSLCFGALLAAIPSCGVIAHTQLLSYISRLGLWLSNRFDVGRPARATLRASVKMGWRFWIICLAMVLLVFISMFVFTAILPLQSLENGHVYYILMSIVLTAVFILFIISWKWSSGTYSTVLHSRSHISRRKLGKYMIIRMLTDLLYFIWGLLILGFICCALLFLIVPLFGLLCRWQLAPVLRLAAENNVPEEIIADTHSQLRTLSQLQPHFHSLLIIGGVALAILLGLYFVISISPALKLLNRKAWYCFILVIGAISSWACSELLSSWMPSLLGSLVGLAVAVFLVFAYDVVLGLIGISLRGPSKRKFS